MHSQAMADLFASLAKPRLMELLKLRSVQHIYDPEPGTAPTKSQGITLDQMPKTLQPYKDIERFVADERVMRYVIDPGLVPLVKSILLATRGRRLLVTRKVAPHGEEANSIVAHLAGFGMRIVLRFDGAKQETQVIWECLYGVA